MIPGGFRAQPILAFVIAPRPVLYIAAGATDDLGYRSARHLNERASQAKEWWDAPEAVLGVRGENRGVLR